MWITADGQVVADSDYVGPNEAANVFDPEHMEVCDISMIIYEGGSSLIDADGKFLYPEYDPIQWIAWRYGDILTSTPYSDPWEAQL